MTSKLIFQEIVEDGSYKARFVEVILPLPMPQTFTYRVPSRFEAEIAIGKRVIVQFGSKKIYTGLISSIHEEPPKAYQAKYFIGLLDKEPVIHEWQISFWQWIAAYYCSSIGEVMAAAFPAHLKMESETKILRNPEADFSHYEISDEEYLIMEALESNPVLSIGEVSELLQEKSVLTFIKSLYDKGYIVLQDELLDAYKPKKEHFVKHLFNIEDAEVKKQLFQSLESAPKQSDILLTYINLDSKDQIITRKKLLNQSNASASALEGLVQKKILEIFEEEVERIEEERNTITVEYELNADQKEALKEIKEYHKDKDVVLLHGITGSGKTHLFMEMIEETIKEGNQALYLVPEIALTAQLVQRLRKKFGAQIGIYHSKFNANEQVEIWNKVLHGDYKVVLGVRSALFLPFKKLGLLIIDEEHEHTYKQYDAAPRYHARDSGIYLMMLHKGKTILGTATPSFETYFNALRGKYGLVKLLSRFGNIQLPEIFIADMREETRKKTAKSHFSSLLYNHMQETLASDGQVILFQNRRGYSPLLECQNCGWVPSCQNCDISLTYHQAYKQVICHYCGYKEDTPRKCKACGQPTLKMLGFGTEKIEDELQIFFPDNKSLRMDQDTTSKKYAYNAIIRALEDGDAQILVGTQMVTKGLDFEKVRLVGILSADQLLRYPDFRAVERSYQLMSQVSGRAGRRGIRGKVIIQTYAMEHPVFKFLLEHDYEGFYEAEISDRLYYRYPPFYKLIKITLKDAELEKVKVAAQWFADRLKEELGPRVLGPEFPSVARIRNKYLMNIMIKLERSGIDIDEIKKQILMEANNFRSQKDFRKVRLTIDVDPF